MDKREKLRIVFMGTPDFAVTTLAKLIANNYDIVGVITAPDRPAGRGRTLQQSPVKQYAQEKGLSILQPFNLKDPLFIENLTSLGANLQIVVAFRMLPRVIWQMPKYGTFNLHASLLPDYRGAAPINWAIINGETETGVTTFFIDGKIDTGEIILQKKTDIGEKETAGELHDRLMRLGADLVLETVALIEGDTVHPKKQKTPESTKVAPKIFKETCEVDWTRSVGEVYNFIKGLSPYPAAWSTLIDKEERTALKIYKASLAYQEHNFTNGRLLIEKKTMKVALKGGFINLLEIQLAGKRKMKASELLNGLNLSDYAKMM